MVDALIAQAGINAKLRIYSGAEPANVAAAITGTLLAELICSASAFAPASTAGVLSPTLPATLNAVATNTATHWRVYKADGTTAVIQGSAGTTGTDMILNTTSIVSGGPVAITSWTITGGGQ
jgi:hypothetical protein